MSYQIEQKRTLAFLRLPFEAKRRRVRPLLQLARRLTKPLVALAGLAGFVLWLLLSPQFDVAVIEYQSGARVDSSTLERRMAAWRGNNLFLVDLDDVRSVLLEDPWIEKVTLRKQLPDALNVRVTEREPVALWRRPAAAGVESNQGDQPMAFDQFAYLDRTGRIIAPSDELDAKSASSWLVVDADPSLSDVSDAERATALALIERLQNLQPSLETIEVGSARILTTGDLRLELRSVDFPVLVDPSHAESQLARFARLHRPLVARGVIPRAVDLRFSGRVLVEPAAELGKQES